ncbi:hypothetical protein KKH30_00145, partial [Candidatus Micrarchaeota archaeon]|nr:hypothetical protein [Candidatus Micrarchaeota archaeon]
MKLKLVLVLAALLVFSGIAAAEQCVVFKGYPIGTAYEVLTNAGLEDVPSDVHIDAYAQSDELYVFIDNPSGAGDTGVTYAYHIPTSTWYTYPTSQIFPTNTIDSIGFHPVAKTWGFTSGEKYWVLDDARVPVKSENLFAKAVQLWNLSENPRRGDALSFYTDAQGRVQIYLVNNAMIDGKFGMKEWFQSGPNSDTWNFRKSILSEIPAIKLEGIQSIDAMSAHLGKNGMPNGAWGLFVTAPDCGAYPIPIPEVGCSKQSYEEGEFLLGAKKLYGAGKYINQPVSVLLKSVQQGGIGTPGYTATFELYDSGGNLIDSDNSVEHAFLNKRFMANNNRLALGTTVWIDNVTVDSTTGKAYVQASIGDCKYWCGDGKCDVAKGEKPAK